MYLAIEGCRSATDLADHIRANLAAASGIQLARIAGVPFTYSDEPINFKLFTESEAQRMGFNDDLPLITEESAEGHLNDTHVVLAQRLVDPFSQRPAHYAALELIRARLSGEITEEESARKSMGKRLQGYFRKGAVYGNGNERGQINRSYFRDVWEALECFVASHPEMSLNEFDSDREAHHSVQSHLERIVKPRSFNDQMQELMITARTLHQYRARSISVAIPYLEGRSDRDKTYGEGNLSRWWAEQMSLAGITQVITWRKHSDRQVSFYEQNGISIVEVYEQQDMRQKYIDRLVEKLANQFGGASELVEKLVVVGPDEGSKEETRFFAQDLTEALKDHPSLGGSIPTDYEVPWIVYQKNRAGKAQHIEAITPMEGHGIDISARLGSKIVVLRDDIWDTGGTMIELLKSAGIIGDDYKRLGTGNCFVVVDAPVFSGGGIDHVFALQQHDVLYELYAARIIEPPTRPEVVGKTIGYFDITAPFTEQVRQLHLQLQR